MTRLSFYISILPLIIFSYSQTEQKKYVEFPKYIFYLHGRIIEDQGINAFSERFGKYKYTEIIERFKKENFNVKSEVRPQGTDNNLYAKKIAKEINELIEKGIPANHITVVGASKGAVIAMLISTEIKNKAVNFIIMGNCNDWVMENHAINLHGNILSIYEGSDEIGGNSCEKIFSQCSGIQKKKEIKLNTGLGHGFLYRPMEEWVKPVIAWAKN